MDIRLRGLKVLAILKGSPLRKTLARWSKKEGVRPGDKETLDFHLKLQNPQCLFKFASI